jgi:hypothetical protein
MSTLAIQERDERLGAAMIAHAMMRDDAAVELLAREHDDPAALAAAVAHAARRVLSLTGLRAGQSNLFEPYVPYGHALWLAQDVVEEI